MSIIFCNDGLKAGLEPRMAWTTWRILLHGALIRARRAWPQRQFQTQVAADLPLGWTDSVLLEQALFKPDRNAVKYSPADAPVTLTASLAAVATLSR